MATNFQFHSEALGAIHESMEALLEIGAISKTTMREFDEACLKPAKPLTPEDIRALRGVSAGEHLSLGARKRQTTKVHRKNEKEPRNEWEVSVENQDETSASRGRQNEP